MRALWTGGLSLTLGWLVGAASAGEPVWRPATAQTAAAASPTPFPARTAANGVALERPRPITAPPPSPTGPTGKVDSQVHQASYRGPSASLLRPTIRAQSSDASPPMPPAPVWPADGEDAGALLPPPTPIIPPVSTALPRVPAVSTSDPAPTTFATARPVTAEECFAGAEEVYTCEAMYTAAPRFYFGAEYLLWDIKNDRYPALVTTGPVRDPNNPLDRVGVLGGPGTQVLFGGDDVDSNMRSGARFNAGYWFDPCNNLGVDGSIFFLAERSVRFNVDSGAFPVITRPFFDATRGREVAEATAAPGVSAGRLTITAPSRLWGGDINLRKNWLCGCFHRVDLLAGFRYLDLEEELAIREDIQVNLSEAVRNNPELVNLQPFDGNRIVVIDQFSTRNRFYGGQLGTVAEFTRGRWALDFRGKIGLGITHQTVDISGVTARVLPGGGQQLQAGGLLTAPSNIGHYTRDRFSVVPEVGVTIGYYLTDHVKVFAGYNFLYWTNVVRPGGQIDRNINPNLIPLLAATQPPNGRGGATPAVPAPQLRDTDFWAHGVSFGLEFRY